MIDAQRRKELKSSYRQSRPIAGIYKITNTVVGRALVTSTTNLTSAKNRFDFATAQKSTGALDQRLKHDVAAHGFDSLSFEVLETLEPSAETTDAELAAELKTLEALCREQLVGIDFY